MYVLMDNTSSMYSQKEVLSNTSHLRCIYGKLERAPNGRDRAAWIK